jgi:hypothetical protein
MEDITGRRHLYIYKQSDLLAGSQLFFRQTKAWHKLFFKIRWMDINIFGRKKYPCTGPSPRVNNGRSLAPKINIHLMAYKKKTESEDVYRQKSYFHFRFNTNSGGFFPMQSFFYLKLQGYQIWA